MKKLVIVGTSDLGQIAYEYFTYDSDYDVVAFAVNREFIQEDKLYGLPIVALEDLADLYPNDEFCVHVALTYQGVNTVRRRLFDELKAQDYTFANYISSKAFVWRNVELGENVFIFENNVVQPFCKVGNCVVLWSGNHIGHHSEIKDNCFISSHVALSGRCVVGENCFIGVNSSIGDNIKLAPFGWFGQGCVVTKDTIENRIYTGVPAKPRDVTTTDFFGLKNV
mgnify:CR=1 FL=1